MYKTEPLCGPHVHKGFPLMKLHTESLCIKQKHYVKAKRHNHFVIITTMSTPCLYIESTNRTTVYDTKPICKPRVHKGFPLMKLKQSHYISDGSNIWVNVYKGFPHNKITNITTVYEIKSLRIIMCTLQPY